MRCEGYRRRGGAFTLGPVKWEQCEEEAAVRLTVKQDNKVSQFPACMVCWNEAIATAIEIQAVVPLPVEIV